MTTLAEWGWTGTRQGIPLSSEADEQLFSSSEPLVLDDVLHMNTHGRNSQPFDAHCCHIGTAVKHPGPDQVKLSFAIFWYPDTLTLHPERQSARMSKNYKLWLNPVWHRMLYSCTHMATVGVKWLKCLQNELNLIHDQELTKDYHFWHTVHQHCTLQLAVYTVCLIHSKTLLYQYHVFRIT